MTAYDLWLDENLEEWYSDEDTEDWGAEPEWDGPYPEDDYEDEFC